MIRATLIGALLICTCGTVEARDLPRDFKLPPAPGPFVGKEKSPCEFRSGRSLIATSYFYWYDVESGAHIKDADGRDGITEHPPTFKGFSYKNVAWHARQLSDMMAAGIDVVMPVYWGTPEQECAPDLSFSNAGLPKLIEARERLLGDGKKPPPVAMFYDTSSLIINLHGYHVDLTTAAGHLWFYGTIRDFFSLIPPRHRACIDGKPLVFLYAKDFAKNIDAKLFPTVREMFKADFGSDLYIVKMPGWPIGADSEYNWGAALVPKILDTAAIGPGYDQSALRERPKLVQNRLGGDFYRFSWEKLLNLDPVKRPWLVHIETWNEFHEGTQICESQEYGRQYIDMTRKYAALFHAKKRVENPYIPPIPETVCGEPGQEIGLNVSSQPNGDGPVIEKVVGGNQAWVTAKNKFASPERYMYFNVDNFFLYDGNEPLEITISYFDDGPTEFLLQYASSDQNLQGVAQEFRLGHRQAIAGSKTWKEVTIVLPHVRFDNGTNGADFRLACAGGELCVKKVLLRRPKKV